MNVYQNAFQIFFVIQKLNHILHNKPLLHYFWKVFSQLFLGVYAYKDPVENQDTQNYISEFPNRFRYNVFAYEH